MFSIAPGASGAASYLDFRDGTFGGSYFRAVGGQFYLSKDGTVVNPNEVLVVWSRSGTVTADAGCGATPNTTTTTPG